jgi:hypothetical protein
MGVRLINIARFEFMACLAIIHDKLSIINGGLSGAIAL